MSSQISLVIASGLDQQSLLSPNYECLASSLAFGLVAQKIVKRFLQSGRSGFCLIVLEEGRVTAGDSLEWLTRDEQGVTVADIVNLYKADETNQDLLRRASELPALPPFGETTFANASGIRIADLFPGCRSRHLVSAVLR